MSDNFLSRNIKQTFDLLNRTLEEKNTLAKEFSLACDRLIDLSTRLIDLSTRLTTKENEIVLLKNKLDSAEREINSLKRLLKNEAK